MTIIQTSKEIKAPVEKVWRIISDVDKDPEFWFGTKSIKNIEKKENKIERETIIAFRDSKCKEIVMLDDKKSVNIEIIEGPVTGQKNLTIEKINDKESRLNVVWNIHMKGISSLFTFMVKKHILKGTEDALERIANKCENV